MKLFLICSILLSIALLVVPGHSQRWGRKAPSLEQILIESEAEVIFVGEVDGYGRSYSPEGKGDSTYANYRVLQVLKGDTSISNIAITMPGHIGFGEGKTIVFATTESKRVEKDGMPCSSSPCYFALFEWSIPYSKANVKRVVNAISSKSKKNKK